MIWDSNYIMLAKKGFNKLDIKLLPTLDDSKKFVLTSKASIPLLSNGLLYLTHETYGVAGQMVYDESLLATRGFSAAFELELNNRGDSLDGFTFTISDSINRTGTGGPNLGYAGEGNANSASLEFDMLSNDGMDAYKKVHI